MSGYRCFVCPVEYNNDTNSFTVDCEPSDLFRLHEYSIPEVIQSAIGWKIVRMYPFQIHSVALSTFASLIGPFGGFFASGFKRAFKIKVGKPSLFLSLSASRPLFTSLLPSSSCPTPLAYLDDNHQLSPPVSHLHPVVAGVRARKAQRRRTGLEATFPSLQSLPHASFPATQLVTLSSRSPCPSVPDDPIVIKKVHCRFWPFR